MNQYLKTIQDVLHQNKNLTDAEKETIIKTIADADKQWSITDFKLDRTEKVKRTTAILLEETIEELEQKRKAVEAQNRELEIESAMERVRARTMAMQKSDELPEAANLLFMQVQSLGMPAWSAGYCIWDENKKGITLWMSSEGVLEPPFHAPLTEDPAFIHMREAYERGETFYVEEMGGEELVAHYKYMRTLPEVGEILDSVIDAGHPLPTFQIFHLAYFSRGFLLFITYQPVPEVYDIFKRFATVFDQTYTRFLDLQKAEAQAREAQIEAALERVRASAMSMQHSDELSEVLSRLFEQFDILGISPVYTFLSLIDLENNSFTYRQTGKGGKRVIAQQTIDLNAMDIWKDVLDKWKESKYDTVETMHVPVDLVPEVFEVFKEIYSQLPEEAKVYPTDFPDGMHTAVASSAFGHLGYDHHRPSTEEEKSILLRFNIEFVRLYKRFLDLQKAEAQTRESQIEAALERVRSKVMAMSKSKDLNETSLVFGEQLRKLGIEWQFSYFWLVDESKNENVFWITWPDYRTSITSYTMYEAEKYFNDCLISWRAGVKVHDNHVLPEGVTVWLDTYQRIVDDAGGEAKRLMVKETFPDGVYYYDAMMRYGSFGICVARPATDEEKNIQYRFGTEFERAYTRFLDLQRAEAQAREARIEAALEKVRSRSLAMHKSDELQDVVHTVFEKLKELDVDFYTVIIIIFQEGSKDIVWWMQNKINQQYPKIVVRYADIPYLMDVFEAREKGNEILSKCYLGEEKNEFYSYLLQQTDLKHVAEQQKKFLLENEFAAMSVAIAKNTGIHITSYSKKSFSEEENETLKRFARVFEQAYIRFMDLQKAEAQATEAQIEAALERVRSKTMAMHRTEDLNPAVAVVFEELEKLNLGVLRCGISVLDKEKRTGDVWVTSTNEAGSAVQVSGDEQFDIHPLLQGAFDAWERQEDFYYVLQGADLASYYNAVKAARFQLPESQFVSSQNANTQQHCFVAAYHGGGLFAFQPTEFSNEAKKVMKRFANVFDLTYKRFLDLQKAEAQARQAQIETALEKVRSRALAMQKPEELVEVAQVLRKEMGLLGVEELETSSIYIHDEASGRTECWYAIQDVRDNDRKLVTDHMSIILDETWVGREMLKFYASDQKQASILMQGENRKEWINYCAQHSAVLQGYYGDEIPERTYHLIKFSNGYMGAASPGAISAESWNLLQRATSVFSLAYTRFSDLLKSEANTKEAVKQAALDRIRADIASMRTVTDLEKITPLIWNELTTIGIPFIRCGVFIMDDEQKLIHTFLSTPDGKAIGAFHIPYDTPGNIESVIGHWRDKSIYTDHWSEAAFAEFANTLVKQNALASPDQYLKTIPRGGFYLHFLPFLQGMLYVGNHEMLDDEKMKLIQSVADAFSTAYARYEDFSKLEAAKQQIEKTLVDLKQAQTQLVQAEKMASLGELTAGIAHEIQNPLNFVNNFSEINKELLVELKDELDKGNLDEVKTIADDVIGNQEKINHHGKRADAIVKGMLQHSKISTGQKEATDINALADEYLRLSYHGLRAKDKTFNATLKTDFDPSIAKINIVAQDIGRVLLNLYNNAFYAVSEKTKQNVNGYNPLVGVSVKRTNGTVKITITDNGNGIPENVIGKIFQPFFTTKPTGQGTGLGLSLSYDIIKAHGGELKVETKECEGSEFIVEIPIKAT